MLPANLPYFWTCYIVEMCMFWYACGEFIFSGIQFWWEHKIILQLFGCSLLLSGLVYEIKNRPTEQRIRLKSGYHCFNSGFIEVNIKLQPYLGTTLALLFEVLRFVLWGHLKCIDNRQFLRVLPRMLELFYEFASFF